MKSYYELEFYELEYKIDSYLKFEYYWNSHLSIQIEILNRINTNGNEFNL